MKLFNLNELKEFLIIFIMVFSQSFFCAAVLALFAVIVWAILKLCGFYGGLLVLGFLLIVAALSVVRFVSHRKRR